MILLITLTATPGSVSAHYDATEGFVKNYNAGYSQWVKVCPPFEASGWDTANITRHKRIDEVLVQYNALNTELHFQEVGTSCNVLKNDRIPFLHIVYDDQNCYSATLLCNAGAMYTYTETVNEFDTYAQAWSSDGSGNCADPPSGDNCIIWAEIVMDSSYRDAATSSRHYWGNDPDVNYNHDYWTAKGQFAHEMGHVAGLPHVCRSAPNSPCTGIVDPLCSDFVYPSSSNAIMCEVIESGEWNTTLKAHDSNAIFAVY